MAGPVFGEDATHRDAPLLAMQRAVKIQVVFYLSEERQCCLPVPALGTQLAPFVVVVRAAAVEELAVDR